MGKSNTDWIVCCQAPEVLKKFSGPVAWVNQCLRCGREEPVFMGQALVAVYQGRLFINMHRHCKEVAKPSIEPNLKEKRRKREEGKRQDRLLRQARIQYDSP